MYMDHQNNILKCFDLICNLLDWFFNSKLFLKIKRFIKEFELLIIS